MLFLSHCDCENLYVAQKTLMVYYGSNAEANLSVCYTHSVIVV